MQDDDVIEVDREEVEKEDEVSSDLDLEPSLEPSLDDDIKVCHLNYGEMRCDFPIVL